jgi:formylglycine-generating enzyme required for sulfatase activity
MFPDEQSCWTYLLLRRWPDGPYCPRCATTIRVDIYEASVWSSPTGGTQFGVGAKDYPCNDNGNDCADPSKPAQMIFARSLPGVIPSSYITWFQAQQACANVEKRLLRNGEWQMAAAATPDPGTDNGTTDCNIGTAGAKVPTGSRSNCVSNFGVFDMVGNVNEWVEDWFEGDTTPFVACESSKCTADTNYGNDTMYGVNPATQQGLNSTNFPAALVRGNTFLSGKHAGVFSFDAVNAPSTHSFTRGFRCAR